MSQFTALDKDHLGNYEDTLQPGVLTPPGVPHIEEDMSVELPPVSGDVRIGDFGDRLVDQTSFFDLLGEDPDFALTSFDHSGEFLVRWGDTVLDKQENIRNIGFEHRETVVPPSSSTFPNDPAFDGDLARSVDFYLANTSRIKPKALSPLEVSDRALALMVDEIRRDLNLPPVPVQAPGVVKPSIEGPIEDHTAGLRRAIVRVGLLYDLGFFDPQTRDVANGWSRQTIVPPRYGELVEAAFVKSEPDWRFAGIGKVFSEDDDQFEALLNQLPQ